MGEEGIVGPELRDKARVLCFELREDGARASLEAGEEDVLGCEAADCFFRDGGGGWRVDRGGGEGSD